MKLICSRGVGLVLNKLGHGMVGRALHVVRDSDLEPYGYGTSGLALGYCHALVPDLPCPNI